MRKYGILKKNPRQISIVHNCLKAKGSFIHDFFKLAFFRRCNETISANVVITYISTYIFLCKKKFGKVDCLQVLDLTSTICIIFGKKVL